MKIPPNLCLSLALLIFSPLSLLAESDTPAPSPVPASQTLPSGLKIMPLGDSITQGSGSAGGYRLPLHDLLAPVAPGFQFVGDSTDNSQPLPANQRSHAGHASYAYDDITRNLDGLDEAVFKKHGGASRDPHGGYWLTGGHGTGRAEIDPDVILLLCGANDVKQPGAASPKTKIRTLLTKLTTLRPEARILLARMTPYPAFAAKVSAFNHDLDEVAAKFQADGKNVTVVDLHTGYPEGAFVDGVHPNAAGYAWMAAQWYAALLSTFGQPAS